MAELTNATPDPTHPTAAAPQAEIRILGPIEVVAAGREPGSHRARCTELLVFLALHPKGVDSDELAAAVWGDGAVPPTTLSSEISRTRSWIRAPEVRRNDILTVRGQYVRLSPAVRLDWRTFDSLVLRACSRGADGIDDLRSAMGLVRGPALSGCPPGRYRWLEETLFAYEIRAAIVDAADRLARLCLHNGDFVEADDAAQRGLENDWYAEQLWRVRLRAHAGLRNVERVRTLVEYILRLIDEPEPETCAVIDSVRRAFGVRSRQQCGTDRAWIQPRLPGT